MSETLKQVIPTGEWINLSAIVGLNAFATNSGNSVLIVLRSATKPDDDVTDGKRIKEDLSFEYVLDTITTEKIWVTSLKVKGIVSVDPGEAVGRFKGALSSYDSDVNSKMINEHLRVNEGTTDTFAVAASTDDNIITVVDGTKFTANDRIVINEGDTHDHGTFKIVTVATNDLTLDKPLENDYSIGAVVTTIIKSMNVNGSITPVVYTISPPADEIWHIYRLTIAMVHTSQPSDDLFGDLAKLTKGIVLRQVNGINRNLSVWRDNTDILEDTGVDLRYSAKSGGGLFGTAARWTFKRAGTVLTLDGTRGDSVIAIIQDNLLALSDLEIKVQGHVEGT